jgi:hypothetical protein
MGTPRFTILAKKGNKISFYEYVGHSALRSSEMMDFTAVQKKFRRLRRVLITKNATKRLDFYAPYIYEKQCPGRKGRVAIIKIATLFTAQTKLQMD